jgi:hypothetical protein
VTRTPFAGGTDQPQSTEPDGAAAPSTAVPPLSDAELSQAIARGYRLADESAIFGLRMKAARARAGAARRP